MARKTLRFRKRPSLRPSLKIRSMGNGKLISVPIAKIKTQIKKEINKTIASAVRKGVAKAKRL